MADIKSCEYDPEHEKVRASLEYELDDTESITLREAIEFFDIREKSNKFTDHELHATVHYKGLISIIENLAVKLNDARNELLNSKD
jgi:hypothetical protein